MKTAFLPYRSSQLLGLRSLGNEVIFAALVPDDGEVLETTPAFQLVREAATAADSTCCLLQIRLSGSSRFGINSICFN
jgi:hypothetical protein